VSPVCFCSLLSCVLTHRAHGLMPIPMPMWCVCACIQTVRVCVVYVPMCHLIYEYTFVNTYIYAYILLCACVLSGQSTCVCLKLCTCVCACVHAVYAHACYIPGMLVHIYMCTQSMCMYCYARVCDFMAAYIFLCQFLCRQSSSCLHTFACVCVCT